MKLKVSIGEAIDKFTILEIKKEKILDLSKKKEIEKELNELDECSDYKNKYCFFFKLLLYINEQIWDKTNLIKSMNFSNDNYAQISFEIFELNQKRFRIKSWFNNLTISDIKEQKSYDVTYCEIIMNEKELIFIKNAEINYLLLNYDVVSFKTSNNYDETIKNIYINPNIIYESETKILKNMDNIKISIDINDFVFPENENIKFFKNII
jgi:hypothetical protein